MSRAGAHRLSPEYGGKRADLIIVDELQDYARQTRLESLIEAVVNVMIGFWINFTANLLILPAFGFKSLTVKQNFIIGTIYTAISIARSYAIRRWAQGHLRAFKARAAAALVRLLEAPMTRTSAA